MKTIEISCFYCKNIFNKALNEYKRQNKKHNNEAKFFCSKKCSVSNMDFSKLGKKNYIYLKGKIPLKSLDEHSIFRAFIRSVKTRSKQKTMEYDLTPKYLKQIWDNQKRNMSINWC